MNLRVVLLFAIAILQGSVTTWSAEATLKVGSQAPQLDIEHWVQNGEGRFQPVTNFKKGEVYVVEFWATWCPPCRESMPHLSKLQKKYQDKGVTIVSVSDEELQEVTDFLAAPENKKYAEATKAYCLTTDPDLSTAQSYMNAAQQDGIPCAFLVGKAGIVEWIGHPIELDNPLEQVVAGSWDRQAFIKQQEELATKRKLFELAMKKVEPVMIKAQQAFQQDDVATAVKLIDPLIQETSIEQIKLQLMFTKFQFLALKGTGEQSTAAYQQIVTANEKDANLLTQLALVVTQMSEGGVEVTDPLIKEAKSAAAKAAKLAPDDASPLSVLAKLMQIEGNVDLAIKLQTKAVELSEGPQKQNMQKFLSELTAAKNGSGTE